eukprot:TRINITY_DN74244_c0_g1_i1.p1 TRINITY_DN74244_c0_g1~~TRINITY_DN74244_c0_g1_i1.p1  ORF type:complete len:518 (+),score=40.13 TRINITY_DN74244_c0_g1_i1:96-1556(+)
MELAQLPTSCITGALSFITHESCHLRQYSALCRGFAATLSEETAWIQLCKDFWYATEKRISDWPQLSARGLYRALEQWTPLEGYYVLAPAFPWGLLVLLRLTEGCVKADVIRFISRQGSESLDEVLVPLFRISLSEETQGSVQSVVDASWLNGNAAMVGDLRPRSLRAWTDESVVFQSPWIWQARLFRARRAVRIAAGSEAKNAGECEDDPNVVDPDLLGEAEPENDDDAEFDAASPWRPGGILTSVEEASSRTQSMLELMFGEKKRPCDLALIQGPADFVPRDPGVLRIRPGLYSGDYGHDFYGQYRTETLLVEYLSLTAAEVAAEVERPLSVFARPQGEAAPAELNLLRDLGVDITFIRGTKQCGDFHVPMGATTFVAVGGPVQASEALAQGASPPRMILSRQTGREESVVRSWRGWGTLATPGFGHPSWAGGWLVQLEDDRAGGDHRFGFVWDRNQDAVVLHWIRAQDTYPFLQRAWLPEDLQ